MPAPVVGSLAAVASSMGVEDVLVFELRTDGASLVGGVGRGAGWAGVVELTPGDEPLLEELLDRRRVVRVEGDAPSRVVGPYWATHAALIPVAEHMVVVGGREPVRGSSGELVRHATEAVALVGDVPSAKLLADELELVQAVQQLNEFAPRSLADAATHAASVAADALACEIGVILLRRGEETQVYGAGGTWPRIAGDVALTTALHGLAERAASGPIVEQDLEGVGANGLRIVSCYALGIGRDGALGALIVGHTDERPRGFTLLCRRVGRALADAAEASLLMAIAHEELAAQRDRYAREARTDLLTGLANRIQWEDELATAEARWQRYGRPVVLVSIDLDDLKATNDAHGHAAGDRLLVAAADILRRSIRATDIVARIGGDEFAALLLETDAAGADALRARVMAACAAWRGASPDERLSISIGLAAPVSGESLRDALARADRDMYAAKHGVSPAAEG